VDRHLRFSVEIVIILQICSPVNGQLVEHRSLESTLYPKMQLLVQDAHSETIFHHYAVPHQLQLTVGQ
jgi:hypothetical protein